MYELCGGLGELDNYLVNRDSHGVREILLSSCLVCYPEHLKCIPRWSIVLLMNNSLVRGVRLVIGYLAANVMIHTTSVIE